MCMSVRRIFLKVGGGVHMVILLTVSYRTVSSDSTLMHLVCLADKSWLRGFMPGGDACKHARFFWLTHTHRLDTYCSDSRAVSEVLSLLFSKSQFLNVVSCFVFTARLVNISSSCARLALRCSWQACLNSHHWTDVVLPPLCWTVARKKWNN